MPPPTSFNFLLIQTKSSSLSVLLLNFLISPLISSYKALGSPIISEYISDILSFFSSSSTSSSVVISVSTYFFWILVFGDWNGKWKMENWNFFGTSWSALYRPAPVIKVPLSLAAIPVFLMVFFTVFLVLTFFFGISAYGPEFIRFKVSRAICCMFSLRSCSGSSTNRSDAVVFPEWILYFSA